MDSRFRPFLLREYIPPVSIVNRDFFANQSESDSSSSKEEEENFINETDFEEMELFSLPMLTILSIAGIVSKNIFRQTLA